ncbi:DNA topoisomerase [Nitzschia inconspicua]|uniref:DNA topoisomerase n=1 Tax=Nitzschia inconspicua TaxID=303405 RepID=A0A9K3LEL7_9STRA|nr:DNA topoisomerase [Nitzschia inconspicua]
MPGQPPPPPPPRHNGPPIILNVAEKPSVARALAGAFHRIPQSREAAPMRREAAQIFTHDNVCFPYIFSQGHGGTGPSRPHRMITTSVRGHLASIEFGSDYGWSRCDPVQLFEAPIEIVYKDDMQPLKRMLERLSKTVDAVILWLDCDREGEAIGDEVMQVCVGGNPRLRPYVYRAKFSTVMDAEIRRALSTLGRLNDHFVQAVNARSELDLRTGAAFTRFQTLRLQKKFHLPGNGNNGGGGSSGVISYGPCQFPTLGFVVERWARIETFVPEEFWFLELTLRVPQAEINNTPNETTTTNRNNHNNNNNIRPIVFTWKRNRLYDRMITLALYESCMETQTAVVTQLSGRPKNKWRPVPLATVELQKRASRYLRIGSETLMSAAEELYQQGYISYPRTETEKFRPEFQHQPLIQDFANLNTGPFADYANRLLNENGFQNPRAGQHDDQAHPPITPCKAVDPATIDNPTQRNVYILVVKHYLACCSRDAIGRETTLTVRIASEEFTAKGLMIEQKNWLEIYEPWERWSTGQGELPALQIGSRVTPSSLLMKDGTTTAPQPISETELITLMDKCGIGTDATIAQHISTIQERDYATKDHSQRFLPTPLGIALIEGYNSMGYQLNKPDLRRETEHECNLVANSQKTKDDIVGPILNKMKDCYVVATRDAHKLDEAMARHFQRIGASNDTTVLQRSFSECGTCQNQMSLKQERNSRGGGGNDRRKLLYCNTCQIGYMMPRKGQIRPKTDENNTESPVRCQICNFQVISIARGDGYEGNGYTLCPKCYSDPPANHGGASSGGTFACFACTHPTCTLAGGTQGGDVEVFGCPFCRDLGNRGGKVLLKKNTRGYVLSCSNYSSREKCAFTIWLPKASQSVSVSEDDDGICRRCSTNGQVKKVSFVWRSGGVPPHLGRETTTCILCDTRFREDLQIQIPRLDQVRPNNRQNNSGRGTVGRGGNNSHRNEGSHGGRGRGRGRGMPNRNHTNSSTNGQVCFRCNQPGHYANACPTRTQ